MSVKFAQPYGEGEPLLRQRKEDTKPQEDNALHYKFSHPIDGWESLPEEIRPVFSPEAASIPGDCGNPQDVKPEWYDEKLFREGQRVAKRHFVGISFASLMGIFLEYSLVEGMSPLISTERSTSPKAAGRRYLSTVFKFLSWYSGDPFDPKSRTYKNLVNVRRAHERVRRDLAACSPEERKIKFTIGRGQPVDLLCPAASSLQRTFKSYSTTDMTLPAVSRVGPLKGAISPDWDNLQRPYMAQTEMALTQWSMIGIFALKPELFAAPNLTRREIEGVLHTWAVIGYCLGISDRFNFALGDLETVLKRAEIVMRLVIMPNLRSLNTDELRYWEHVMRSIIRGMASYVRPFPGFMASFTYLTEDVLGQKTDVRKTLTWRQTLELWMIKLGMRYLPRFAPWFMMGFNEAFKAMVLRSEALERKQSVRG